MAQPQPVLVVTANLGPDAVPFSGGNAPVTSFAKSLAQSLPGAIACASVNVTVPTGTNTVIPASVFSAGSGVYALFCDGNGNNDLSAVGSVSIVGGAIADSKGFFCSNVNPVPIVTVAVGPPVTATAAATYQILFYTGAAGAYQPTLFQNFTASQVYAVTAIKIANAPTPLLPGGTV
jgi:hypothetical protein